MQIRHVDYKLKQQTHIHNKGCYQLPVIQVQVATDNGQVHVVLDYTSNAMHKASGIDKTEYAVNAYNTCSYSTLITLETCMHMSCNSLSGSKQHASLPLGCCYLLQNCRYHMWWHLSPGAAYIGATRVVAFLDPTGSYLRGYRRVAIMHCYLHQQDSIVGGLHCAAWG